MNPTTRTDAPRTHGARRRVAGVLLALGIAAGGLAPGTAAMADERDDLVRQRAAQEAARNDLGTQLDGVSADLGSAYLALADTEARLPVAEAELGAAETRVTQISDRLVQAQAESDDLGRQIEEGAQSVDTTRSSLGELARTAYRTGGLTSTVSLVTGASSTEEFVDQALAGNAAARTQQDVLVSLESEVALNRNKEARQQAVADRVTQLRDDAVVAQAAAQAKRDEVARLRAEQEARTAELESRRSEIDSQIAEADAARASISQEIARIDEENRRLQLVFEEQQRAAAAAAAQAAQAAEAARAGRPAPPSSGAVNSAGGRFSPPANACVNSEWGMRMHPILGYARLHEGLDMRAGAGVPQFAMTEGAVVSVYTDATGGLMVVLNHGLIDGQSVLTKHLHLTSASVTPGQRVTRGQQIGTTGSSGRVTGAHVHHEVWVNGASVDPRGFYGGSVSSC